MLLVMLVGLRGMLISSLKMFKKKDFVFLFHEHNFDKQHS